MTQLLFTSFAASLCAIAFCAGAGAAGTIGCSLEPTNHPNYVAPSFDVTYDDYGAARVTDAIIAATGQGYVIGQVTIRSNKRMTVRWRVQNVTPDPREYRFRNADLIVRVTIDMTTGKASMSVLDATRSDYSYSAVGTCRLSD